MLKAAGIEPYQHLNVHGYWNVEESKMSKSLGNIVRPLSLKDKYGLDAFRYYLTRDMVFGLDASFSEEAMVSRINADLANDLGNLTSRSLTMAVNYCLGQVPPPGGPIGGTDDEIISTAMRVLTEYKKGMESLAFHKALIAIWELIGAANRYIVENEPWELKKDPSQESRLSRVMYNILETLRFVGTLLIPFIPGAAEDILDRIGVRADFSKKRLDELDSWGGLPPGAQIMVGESLFPRIDVKKAPAADSEKPKKQKQKKKKKGDAAVELLEFDDFKKVELAVGTGHRRRCNREIEKAPETDRGPGRRHPPDRRGGRRGVLFPGRACGKAHHRGGKPQTRDPHGGGVQGHVAGGSGQRDRHVARDRGQGRGSRRKALLICSSTPMPTWTCTKPAASGTG